MIGATFLSMIVGSDSNASAVVAVAQPTTASLTTISSAVGPIVQITKVHTVPIAVVKSSDFRVGATVVNHSDRTIEFTRDCSPLTPQAVFSPNSNIIKVNQKVCNILSARAKILPGGSADIEIPGNFGGMFHASDTTKANSVIIFKYSNEEDTTTTSNLSNTIHQVKVPFSFTVRGGLGDRIVLDNIKTQPSPVHEGDSIRLDAVITNYSSRPIQFLGGPCDSPLSAKFDTNVETLFTPRCLAMGQLITLNPNDSAHIMGPASGILYKAASSGKTISQVSFNFETHNNSNGTVSPHQVTKEHQFKIEPPSSPIVHAQ